MSGHAKAVSWGANQKGTKQALFIVIVSLNIELIHMSQLNKPCNYGALLYWYIVKGNLHQQMIKNEWN